MSEWYRPELAFESDASALSPAKLAA
jgi:hypothetical protein